MKKGKMMKKALAFTLAFSMVSSLMPGTWMNSNVVKAATVTDVSGKTKILEFDFEGADATAALKGKAYNDGATVTEVSATASGVTFQDGLAVFPNDGGVETTGITYTPTSGTADPMKSLGTNGATVSMWVKTGQSSFSSTLFAYGARMDGDSTKDLGYSVQILGRNNQSKNNEVVYYRDNGGQSGGQKLKPDEDYKSPYKQDEWQLVTMVENTGSLTLYVDGVQIGTHDSASRKLKTYANDGYADAYYFGFLPYVSAGDSHFVGAMDSITVYNGALTAGEVELLYERGLLQYKVNEASTYMEDDYTPTTWTAFLSKLVAARTTLADTDATKDEVYTARKNLETAIDGLNLAPLPKAVLKFDFTGTDAATALKGKANIGGVETEVTATVPEGANVTFDGTSAIFKDATDAANASTVKCSGIVYTPEAGKDPMAQLTDSLATGTGATITMWVKSDRSEFSSSLFAYGALQTEEVNGGEAKIGKLGASAQIVARNGQGKDNGVVYYRDEKGNTGFDVGGTTQYQKIKQDKSLTPFKKDTWQIVTYVEQRDGNGILYIDGVKIGTTPAAARSLYQYATDAYGSDRYYIGHLPYEEEGDTRFSGAIGGLTVYGAPLSEERVMRLYEEGQLELVLGEAKAYYVNETEYSKVAGWAAFKKAYTDASETALTSEAGLAIPAERLRKLRTDLSSALAELKKSVSGTDQPILKFDFEEADTGTKVIKDTDADGTEITRSVVTVKGSGTGVSDEANTTLDKGIAEVDNGIKIEYGVAKFPREADGTVAPHIGITYIPEAGKDPMDTLKEGTGATVSMWVKTNESVFSSSLFSYGALQTEEVNGGEAEIGKIGASTQILARNNKTDKMPTVYGRKADGKSGSNPNRQAIIATNQTPYKQGHWQLVTYVEEIDGTMKMYVDGASIGEVKIDAPRSLEYYANDDMDDDRYYIGFLPYPVSADTRFVGEMDSLAIYGHALSQEEILEQYYEGQLAYAVKEAETYAVKNGETYKAGENVKSGESTNTFLAALNAAVAKGNGNTAVLLENLITAQDALILTTDKTVFDTAKEELEGVVNKTETTDPDEEIQEEYDAILAAAKAMLDKTEETGDIDGEKVTSGDLVKMKEALVAVLGYMNSTSAKTNEPILRFDFEEGHVDSSKNVTGVVPGGDASKNITATSKNLKFEDGVAIFPEDSGNIETGISYTVGENNPDPMKKLALGKGASIAMWIKTDGSDFARDLFTYGDVIEDNGEKKLGASLEVLAKNNPPSSWKDTAMAVYYRDAKGSTKSDKTGGKSQKLKQDVESPYIKDKWQLVVYVEDAASTTETVAGSGTGTLYIDGVKVGRNEVTGHTLYEYATNDNVNSYYIGCLPYASTNGDHFVGAMDDVAIYDTALTSAQVVELYTEYKEAQLESIKTQLQAVLGKAEIQSAYENPSDYTDDTWEDFSEAYESAEKLLNDSETSPEDAEQAIAEVQETYGALKSAVVEAQDELKELIEDVKDLKEADYTPETWSEFAAKLEAANTAATATNLTAAQVTEAQKALQTAYDGLVTKAYKTAKDALNTLVGTASALVEADYAEGWKEFKDALEAAKALNSSASPKTTDPDDLTAATTALTNAQKKLKTKVIAAKEALAKEIETAKGCKKEDYTDKWTEFETALAAAEAVYAKTDATEAEYATATTNLSKARADLVSNARKAFNVAVGEAQILSADKYTEDSWSAFVPVLTAAVSKLTASMSDEEWAAETKILTDAQAALVPKLRSVMKETIEKENEKGYKEEDYTEESWKAYTDALKELEDNVDTAGAEELETLKENFEKAVLVTKQEDAKSRLDVAVREAKVLLEADYTPESWAGFAEALKAAEAATAETTYADLEALITKLSAATEALVMTREAALKALDQAVADAEAKGYKQEDYEKTSWDNYQAALAAAKAREDGATTEVLVGLKDDLVKAEAGLVTNAFAAAKANLDEKIKEIEAREYKKDAYDETSWKEYEEALANAQNPPEGATPEDLEILQETLEAAEAGLVTKEMASAKESLKVVIAAAEARNEADYTPESWAVFKAALDAAKNPKADATVTDIVNLKKGLEDATLALVTKTIQATRDSLAAAVNSVAVLKQVDYTPESWAVFQAALAAASAPDANATEDQLAQLYSNLQAAVNGLQKAVVTPQATDEENKIASQYGVSVEVARKIIEIIKQNNISNDVAALTDQYVTSIKNDKDVKGSVFNMLQARAIKQTGNSVKLKWNKVSGADGYLVYGAKCGDAYKLITTTSKTSYTQKKLKKATYYKYLVLAYKDAGGAKVTMAAAKTVHTVTTGGKNGVAKKVDAPSKVTVGVKKTYKVKAKEVKDKLKIKSHRGLKYESSDTGIATVSGSGKIKGKKKGTCYVYAYAQNGIFKKIKVTVK